MTVTKRKLTEDEVARVLELTREGWARRDVAAAVGTSASNVGRIRRKHGVQTGSNDQQKGALTSSDWRRARVMAAAGYPATEIAEALGCHPSTIRQRFASQSVGEGERRRQRRGISADTANSIRELVAAGWRYADIRRQLGVSLSTIHHYAGPVGCGRRRGTRECPLPTKSQPVRELSPETSTRIQEMVAAGVSGVEISRQLSVNFAEIYHYGGSPAKKDLSATDAESVRHLYQAGVPRRRLAQRFGVAADRIDAAISTLLPAASRSLDDHARGRIIEMAANGATLRQIAAVVGVPKSSVESTLGRRSSYR